MNSVGTLTRQLKQLNNEADYKGLESTVLRAELAEICAEIREKEAQLLVAVEEEAEDK